MYISNVTCLTILIINLYILYLTTEEVILAEERTTDEERRHIIEGDI